jgi:hypothetical protein
VPGLSARSLKIAELHDEQPCSPRTVDRRGNGGGIATHAADDADTCKWRHRLRATFPANFGPHPISAPIRQLE